MNFSGIPDSEREGIIIIHQELALIPLLSIAENISLDHEMLEITGWNVWHPELTDKRVIKGLVLLTAVMFDVYNKSKHR